MNRQMYKKYYDSPLGILEICAENNMITAINFLDSSETLDSVDYPILDDCLKQLDEYFHQQRKKFDIALNPQGTEFQKSVWDQLIKIPYGQSASYMEIAKKLNNIMAIRAVGNANGKNPIPIIIPCHRVIGTDGKLIGYGGRLWRKEWLLKHENALII